MAGSKPYDRKKMFAHKNGQLIQSASAQNTGIVVDVQYPEGSSQLCWVSIMWDDGRIGPLQPTIKYRLLEDK